MSKIKNNNVLWAISISFILSIVAIFIPMTAFADEGENVFTYMFGQLNGNEYDARIPYEDYNNTGEIRFNDKWLTQDTTQYNNALSSFCVNCSDKIEDTSSGEQSIKNYLEENEFEDFMLDGYFGAIGKSNVYSFALKKTQINGRDTDVLMICCRGTKNLSEMIEDTNRGESKKYLDGEIYATILDFSEQVFAGLIKYGNKILFANKDLKIIVAGHSLGGAAANAVAAKITYEAGKDSWWLHKTNKSSIYAYTYGAIKVLGDSYNDDTNLEDGYENIHNVYNWSDSYGPFGSRQDGNGNHIGAIKKKYGHTETFDINMHDILIFPWDVPSHIMSTYKEAINNETVSNKKNYHYLELACNVSNSGEIESDDYVVRHARFQNGFITADYVCENDNSIIMHLDMENRLFTLKQNGILLDKGRIYESTTNTGLMSERYGDTEIQVELKSGNNFLKRNSNGFYIESGAQIKAWNWTNYNIRCHYILL